MNDGHPSRLQDAFLTVHAGDVPRPDCPPAATIWDGVHDQLGPAEFRGLLHHVAVCPICTEAWRLAEKLTVDGDRKSAAVSTASSSARRRFSRAAAFVGLIMTAFVASFLLRDGRERFRAPPADEIRFLTPEPLSREDCILRWQGPADAVYYDLRVSVTTDIMNPLAEESELEATEYRIPSAILEGLPASTELQVYIKAIHPWKGRLAEVTIPVELK